MKFPQYRSSTIRWSLFLTHYWQFSPRKKTCGSERSPMWGSFSVCIVCRWHLLFLNIYLATWTLSTRSSKYLPNKVDQIVVDYAILKVCWQISIQLNSFQLSMLKMVELSLGELSIKFDLMLELPKIYSVFTSFRRPFLIVIESSQVNFSGFCWL